MASIKNENRFSSWFAFTNQDKCLIQSVESEEEKKMLLNFAWTQ